MRFSRLTRRAVTVAAGALVLSALVAVPPSTAALGETATALTDDNQLLRFATNAPGTITATTPITGLQAGENVVGIDFRPAANRLYGYTDQDRVYLIDAGTGAVTPVGGVLAPAPTGTSFGVDFNPVVDRLRIVSDTDQNLRVHPDTGAVVDSDPNTAGTQIDGVLAYAAGDANAGQNPSIVGAAYTNNTTGAPNTTNYAIDSGRDALVTQGSVNGAPVSPNSGQLFTVGPLGFDTTENVGFDIAPDGTAYASLTANAATASNLYTVNLGTGAVTSVGAIGGGKIIRGLAVGVPDPVARLAGPDRIGTAIATSNNSYPGANSATSVVLARSDVFADALAGTPLAVAKDAPLLLSDPTTLTPSTRAELQRVANAGKTVYLLGGPSALSNGIQTELTGLGYTVVRYGGGNRAETAVQIANQGLGNPNTLFLATGTNFPDALSGGAAAAKATAAILLTNGSDMAPATQAYLNTRPGVTRFALGGPAAAADPGATPIVGTDRYDTSRLVAQQFFAAAYTQFGAASGENFPDGLTGGAHIGKRGGPLLLVRPDSVPAVINTYLTGRAASITTGFLYGGTAAVTEGVRLALQAAIT